MLFHSNTTTMPLASAPSGPSPTQEVGTTTATMIGMGSTQFPSKLHQILMHATNQGDDHIISWLPCGKGFRINNKHQFVDTYMQKFFKTSNYKSFHRNLNLWGFSTVRKGPQKGACYHPLFLRDQPTLCFRMKRIKNNNNHKGGGDNNSVGSSSSRPSVSPVQHHVVPQVQFPQVPSSNMKAMAMNDISSLLLLHQYQQQQQQQQQQRQVLLQQLLLSSTTPAPAAPVANNDAVTAALLQALSLPPPRVAAVTPPPPPPVVAAAAPTSSNDNASIISLAMSAANTIKNQIAAEQQAQQRQQAATNKAALSV